MGWPLTVTTTGSLGSGLTSGRIPKKRCCQLRLAVPKLVENWASAGAVKKAAAASTIMASRFARRMLREGFIACSTPGVQLVQAQSGCEMAQLRTVSIAVAIVASVLAIISGAI